MRINVIFDNRQPEDYERLEKEFKEQGVANYTFHAATCHKHTVVGSINASHKTIVELARLQGLDRVCIAEQDLTFTSKGAWKYFLDNEPETYDIYLGATYIVPISNNKICGFHLYIIKQQFYDKFLSVPDDAHIDTAVCDLKGDYKFCYPFPALQRAGYSFNNKDVVDYNSILKPEDIYHGEVHNIQG